MSDLEIEAAFENTNFGASGIEFWRHTLAQGVLKTLAGYHCGHTIMQIMNKYGLIDIGYNYPYAKRVTTKGKEFLYEAFKKDKFNV